MSLGGPDPSDPATSFMRRLAGKWVVQALATAAELGLAEALEQPKTLAELSTALECEPTALLRLMRVLAGEGLVTQDREDRYALTELGAQLRRDRLGTLARFVASPSQWTPWLELTYSVRTGRSAFERVHGRSLFEYLAEHPADARLYDDAVDAFTALQARELARLDVLDGVSTLVDVGGGRGTLLLELLRLRPALRGILFDRPHVIEHARARLRAVEEGMAERCGFVSGDFFESVPAGADAYVLKHVLHNWDDERACALLRSCAVALAPGGRVLVVEGLLVPGDRPDVTRLLDLEMLVLTDGGRERSKPELRRLLTRAGLRLVSARSLREGAWLLVAEPRPAATSDAG